MHKTDVGIGFRFRYYTADNMQFRTEWILIPLLEYVLQHVFKKSLTVELLKRLIGQGSSHLNI